MTPSDEGEFAAIVSAGTLHAARRPVVIIRNNRNRATTRTHCDRDVAYPGSGWPSAVRLCPACLPDQDLDDLRSLNPDFAWPEMARTDETPPKPTH